MLFHLNCTHNCGIHILSEILRHGNAGVDMFLFLSALGLCFSLEKNSIKQFISIAWKRVLIPSVCLAIVQALAVGAFRGCLTLDYVLRNGLLLSYWIDGTGLWYVSFIILLYALFPLIKKADERTKHISSIFVMIAAEVIVLVNAFHPLPYIPTIEKAISRVPIFFCGLLAYPAVKANKPRRLLFLLGILFALTAVLWVIRRRFDTESVSRALLGAAGLSIMYTYTFLRERFGFDRLFKWLAPIGAVSPEFYIWHLTFRDVWMAIPRLNALPRYIIWAGVFAAGLAASFASRALFEKLLKKRPA